jgi:FkbM family methyltransferase
MSATQPDVDPSAMEAHIAAAGEARALRPAGAQRRSRTKRAARMAFLAEARALTAYVAVTVGPELFLTAPGDFGPGREIFVKRKSKDMVVLSRTVAALADLGLRLPHEPLFVDVGANIGTSTVFALRRHAFARGVALEPSPETFRTLRLNLVANDLESRVAAMEFAVSDREGEVAFDATDVKTGRHHVATVDESGDLVVPAVTLDGLVARGVVDAGRVGVLWIDAAGHEAHVLAGATSLTEAGVPVVVALRARRTEIERSVTEPWASLLPHLEACYTDVLDLRKTDTRNSVRPISRLRRFVDSTRSTHDVLLVRR